MEAPGEQDRVTQVWGSASTRHPESRPWSGPGMLMRQSHQTGLSAAGRREPRPANILLLTRGAQPARCSVELIGPDTARFQSTFSCLH